MNAGQTHWARRILVALGGNAMSAPDGSATEDHQIAALQTAAGHIADLIAAGYEVAITHGNGPQVGNLLVKNEMAAAVVPPVSLDWCVAQTQATVGFVLAGALESALARRGVTKAVAALVTRTLVRTDDPAFAAPEKPIGRYRPATEAAAAMSRGQHWKSFGERGWRRVVASPAPLDILDGVVGRQLMDGGTVVIMAGGGGIPVVRADGVLSGVEAVIDKDRSAALLGQYLNCDTLLVATDVEQAVLGWGTPDAVAVGHVSLAEAQRFADEGHFAAGSMGPKVAAAISFVAGTGSTSVITRLDRLADAVTAPLGSVGTVITRSGGTEPSNTEPSSTETGNQEGAGNMPEAIEVRKIPLHSVSDASELTRLIDAGIIDADRIVAVIGKTEGNGGVNDYTRIIADRAFREVIAARGSRPAEEIKQIPIVWSGGTDGVLSPHATVFATVPAEKAEPSDEPRLTVGFAMSEVLLPEDIGRVAMVEKVAAAVKIAMAKAGITEVADVHYVQTKTPLLTIDTIRDAKSRGHDVFTEDTLHSMDVSNGGTALGIAVALGEIEMPTDQQIMADRSLYSAVASCSSGVELDRAQVVVVGNAAGIGGRYRIGHGVMKDALDADGIWAAIRSTGIELPDRPHSSDLKGRLVNVFLKCEVAQDGQVRGRRNAMLDDSDVHWHRQIKACVGGVAASVTGDPAAFVSVSAAHQGPDGGGPVAAIVDLGPDPTGYQAP